MQAILRVGLALNWLAGAAAVFGSLYLHVPKLRDTRAAQRTEAFRYSNQNSIRYLDSQPATLLQIEYSIATRDPEDAIFPVLVEHSIGATSYSASARGLLAASPIGAGNARAHVPRFSAENREANAKLGGWSVRPAARTLGDRIAPNFSPL